MRSKGEFRLFTCHGNHDGEVEIEVTPASSFELIWPENHVNGDEQRIRQCLESGAKEALSKCLGTTAYRVEVLNVEDLDGESPPITFHECIKRAIRNIW